MTVPDAALRLIQGGALVRITCPHCRGAWDHLCAAVEPTRDAERPLEEFAEAPP